MKMWACHLIFSPFKKEAEKKMLIVLCVFVCLSVYVSICSNASRPEVPVSHVAVWLVLRRFCHSGLPHARLGLRRRIELHMEG